MLHASTHKVRAGPLVLVEMSESTPDGRTTIQDVETPEGGEAGLGNEFGCEPGLCAGATMPPAPEPAPEPTPEPTPEPADLPKFNLNRTNFAAF